MKEKRVTGEGQITCDRCGVVKPDDWYFGREWEEAWEGRPITVKWKHECQKWYIVMRDGSKLNEE